MGTYTDWQAFVSLAAIVHLAVLPRAEIEDRWLPRYLHHAGPKAMNAYSSSKCVR